MKWNKFIFAISFFLTFVISCTNLQDFIDHEMENNPAFNGLQNNSLVITSHQNADFVSLPVTISGYKGYSITSMLLTENNYDRSVTIDGTNWEVTLPAGEYDAGIRTFTISGYDSSSSLISNIELVLNITNNGSGVIYINIHGRLTNYYHEHWHVFAGTNGENLTDYIPVFYGYVYPSTSNFIISVPENYEDTLFVRAFMDTNYNEAYEPGEMTILGRAGINVGTEDISNIVISIPRTRNYRMEGTIRNNIYGLPVGALAFNINEFLVYSTSPSTSNIFDYKLIITGAESNEMMLGFYVDHNGDGKWTQDFDIPIYESHVVMTNFTIYELTNRMNVTLTPHMMRGYIIGSGLNEYNLAQLVVPVVGGALQTPYNFYGKVTNDTYEVLFYTPREGMWGTGDNPVFTPSLVKDENKSMLRESNESRIIHNDKWAPEINLTNASTNYINFETTTVTWTAQINGIDGLNVNNFKLAFPNIDGGYDVLSGPSNTYTLQKWDEAAELRTMYAFIDNNINNVFETDVDTYFTGNKYISNVSVTNKFHIMPKTVNISMSGIPVNENLPMAVLQIGANTYVDKAGAFSWSSFTVDGYWNTNSGTFVGTVMLVWDAEGDGEYNNELPITRTTSTFPYFETLSTMWTDETQSVTNISWQYP